jgi:hypothetical protein
MAIDAFQETLVTYADAVKRLPKLREGKSMAASTIYRWASTGSKAADGTRVRLETIKIGGTCCTSLEALQRFFDRLQPHPSAGCADLTAPSFEPTRLTPRQYDRKREAEIRAAERRLRMGGIYGEAHVFRQSKISEEKLCDLHEFLQGWMSDLAANSSDAFRAVRTGIFAYAVEILEGKHGAKRSLEAAKQWIIALDLATFDVRQLRGVGPKFSAEWAAMLEERAIQAMISDQRRLASATQ